MVQKSEVIPGYLISQKLGSGGVGTVFRARETKTFKYVAIKILYPRLSTHPVHVARFLKEAQLLTSFYHPSIVKGFSYGKTNGLYYLVMEYIEGEALADRIQARGRLLEEEALSIIVQVAKALAFLESKGLIHRDIKPENILMTPDHQVKVIDLGFAVHTRPEASEDSEDVTCGTPDYMSPEQVQGFTDLDIRSDIYSLGATLYHMVLGETPFQGTDNLEVMAKQVLERLSTDKTKTGSISPLMQYVIEKMMAKDKAIRYQNPQELIQDVESKLSYYQDQEKAQEQEKIAQLFEEEESEEKKKKWRRSSSIYFSRRRIQKLLGQDPEEPDS